MLLEQEMTIVLEFLFSQLFKTPFKRDRYYNNENLPYEARKLFNKMIKSDIIQNKMNCYAGKSKMYDYQSSHTTKLIQQYLQKEYRNSTCFSALNQHTLDLLDQIENNLNCLLKDIIIKLMHAYENV